MNQVAVKKIEGRVNSSSEKNALNPIRSRLKFWFLQDSCPEPENLDLPSIQLGLTHLVGKLAILISELEMITTRLVLQSTPIPWHGNC